MCFGYAPGCSGVARTHFIEGLAISQRIVSEAGGRIDVRSREGFGTTFVILLPAEGDPQLDTFEAERAPAQSLDPDGAGVRLEPVEP